MVSLDPSIWIAAFFTIAATSYAFRDNIVFKFAENTFIGVAAGHTIVMVIKNIRDYGWTHIMDGEMIYVIVFVLGIMLYARFSDNYYWLYRYPIAFLVGNGVGISIRAAIHSDFIVQVRATASPLIADSALGTVNAIITFVGVVTALSHFIFTQEKMHEGTIGMVPKLGRWLMLLAFGASFGNTIMSRFGMYQGRIIFLLREWLQII
jgi:adenosine/AMP kinase